MIIRALSLAFCDTFADLVTMHGKRMVKRWIKTKIHGGKARPHFALMPALRGSHYNMIVDDNKPRQGTLYIQRHDASHLHHDISIVDKDGTELFRGAVSKTKLNQLFPKTGGKSAFARQPQHTSGKFGYDFTGTIERGYGKGRQDVVFREPIEILRTKSDTVRFNLYKSDTSQGLEGSYAFVKGQDVSERGPGLWIVTHANISRPDFKGKNDFRTITNTKGSQELPEGARQLQEQLQRDGIKYTVEVKADGGANMFELGKKENRIWSWREGKRSPTIFLHNKFPNLRDDIHPEFHRTMGRGELVYVPGRLARGIQFPGVGREHPNMIAKFSLIGDPMRSRLEQKIAGGTSAMMMYDLQRFKGKLVNKMTYGEKMVMMDEISSYYRHYYSPKRWTDVAEAWDYVVTKRGGEGLVVKLVDEPTPDQNFGKFPAWWKIKAADTHDLRIIDWEPLVRKTGEVDRSRVGVLVVENGKRRSEVGSGFTDYERQWYAKHMDEVIKHDSIIKVKAHRVTDSGGLHGPVYRGVHVNKSDGPVLELGLEQSADALGTSPYQLKSAAGWRK